MPDIPAPDADLRRFARWAATIRFLGRFLCRITHRPDVVPSSGGRPVVIVANHRSLADIFVSIETLDHFGLPARCLVRAKYFEIPLIGRWLGSLGCIPAGDGRRGSIELALDTLRSGRPVAIMIEGGIVPPDRRGSDGLGELRPGFIEIARVSGAVVMPITIIGTEDVWASRGRLPRLPWRGRPRVTVHVNDIIVIDEMTDDEVLARTRAAIASQITPRTVVAGRRLSGSRIGQTRPDA